MELSRKLVAVAVAALFAGITGCTAPQATVASPTPTGSASGEKFSQTLSSLVPSSAELAQASGNALPTNTHPTAVPYDKTQQFMKWEHTWWSVPSAAPEGCRSASEALHSQFDKWPNLLDSIQIGDTQTGVLLIRLPDASDVSAFMDQTARLPGACSTPTQGTPDASGSTTYFEGIFGWDPGLPASLGLGSGMESSKSKKTFVAQAGLGNVLVLTVSHGQSTSENLLRVVVNKINSSAQ